MKYDCLIIEGGGFKTAFTAGVMDAFITADFRPFKKIIGISGGSVALSYYMGGQYRYCINAMRYLAKDEQFANYKRAFSEKGYLDIEYIATVASQKVPLDLKLALKESKNIETYIVATERSECKATYLIPDKDTWIQAVIASSTLPFATKGIHELAGKSYYDGGWSDPLPAKWAFSQGCESILIVRTRPVDLRLKQSWANYFGAKYFKSQPKLSLNFETSFNIYNDSADYLQKPPKGVHIDQIAPKNLLKSGTYMYSKKTLMLDYRYGLDKGINFLNKLKK